MTQRNLETLVEQLGLKVVVAMLAQICIRKAEELQSSIGDIEGKATDWRADGTTLRSMIARLKN